MSEIQKISLKQFQTDLKFFRDLVNKEYKYSDFEYTDKFEEAPIAKDCAEVLEKHNYYVNLRYPLISILELAEDYGTHEHSVCEKTLEILSELKGDLFTLFKKYHSFTTIQDEMQDAIIKKGKYNVPAEELEKYNRLTRNLYCEDHFAIYVCQLKDKIIGIIEDLYYIIGLYARSKNTIGSLYDLTENHENVNRMYC